MCHVCTVTNKHNRVVCQECLIDKRTGRVREIRQRVERPRRRPHARTRRPSPCVHRPPCTDARRRRLFTMYYYIYFTSKLVARTNDRPLTGNIQLVKAEAFL